MTSLNIYNVHSKLFVKLYDTDVILCLFMYNVHVNDIPLLSSRVSRNDSDFNGSPFSFFSLITASASSTSPQSRELS